MEVFPPVNSSTSQLNNFLHSKPFIPILVFNIFFKGKEL